jgi:hypothetical protein
MLLLASLVLLAATTSVLALQPQRFSAQVLLTYTGMTQAGQSGRLTYDYTGGRFAVQYSDGFTELYQFNAQYGYATPNPYTLQYVYKLSASGACSPCAQYGLSYGFPFLNLSAPSAIASRVPRNINQGIDADGCVHYSVQNATNFAASFALAASGQLCELTDRTGRQWRVQGGWISDSAVDLSVFAAVPESCRCRQPLDIAIALDRSASISVPGTYYYRAFLASLASSFYFNASDPVRTAQLGIVQWAIQTLPMNFPGSLNFTQSANNVAVATSLVGCTQQTGSCKFCYRCNNQGQQCAAQANTSNSECTAYYGTCAGCGLDGVQQLFMGARNTYVNRTNAKRIMIYITDGNANREVDGDDCSTSGSPPCRTDIVRERTQLMQAIPDLVTYAIGINGVSGFDVSRATLDLISGDSSRTFVEPSFESLVNNLQSYILGFCQLPDPVKECGSCCGFCECGQCVTPDTPLPLNGTQYCDGLAVQVTPGHCYEARFNQTPCTAPPTACDELDRCDPTLAVGHRCVYRPLSCPNVTCYDNQRCVQGVCSGTYVCGTPAPTHAPTHATEAPTRAPVAPLGEGETTAPTGVPTQAACTDASGYYCFANAVCCEDRVSCCCTNNYTGVRCGTPPGVDECAVDGDCVVADRCALVRCVQETPTQKRCQTNGTKDCTDGDACTHDYCDAVDGQCKHQPVVCNDNLQCTDDRCDPAVVLGCVYMPVNCSSVADDCHEAACNDFAAASDEICVRQSVECPLDSNCSIAYCALDINVTTGGCINQTYACDVPFVGIIVGITAGVIAGVTVAAAILVAFGMTAGTAMAVSQTYNAESDQNVKDNPLYQAESKAGQGLAA